MELASAAAVALPKAAAVDATPATARQSGAVARSLDDARASTATIGGNGAARRAPTAARAEELSCQQHDYAADHGGSIGSGRAYRATSGRRACDPRHGVRGAYQDASRQH
jgi:hypothetical protein